MYDFNLLTKHNIISYVSIQPNTLDEMCILHHHEFMRQKIKPWGFNNPTIEFTTIVHVSINVYKLSKFFFFAKGIMLDEYCLLKKLNSFLFIFFAMVAFQKGKCNTTNIYIYIYLKSKGLINLFSIFFFYIIS